MYSIYQYNFKHIHNKINVVLCNLFCTKFTNHFWYLFIDIDFLLLFLPLMELLEIYLKFTTESTSL